MCSKLSVNKMLIGLLIWNYDDIVTHCDDWYCIIISIQHHINDWSIFH
jgi:hypothetical protein